MYFIQQKVSKGIDPPQVLSPDMIPPSERGTPIQVSTAGHIPVMLLWLPAACHQVAAVTHVSRPVPCCCSLPSHGPGLHQGLGVGLGHWDSFPAGSGTFATCPSELEIVSLILAPAGW